MANNFGVSGSVGDVSGSLRAAAQMDNQQNRAIKPATMIETDLHELAKATGELLSRLDRLDQRVQPVSSAVRGAQEGDAARDEPNAPTSPISLAIRGQRDNVIAAIKKIDLIVAHLEI